MWCATSAATPRPAPTTLQIATTPSPTATSTQNPLATGSILMVKLPVGNLAAAEKFYGAVFGAKLAITVGVGAHIVTSPDGGARAWPC